MMDCLFIRGEDASAASCEDSPRLFLIARAKVEESLIRSRCEGSCDFTSSPKYRTCKAVRKLVSAREVCAIHTHPIDAPPLQRPSLSPSRLPLDMEAISQGIDTKKPRRHETTDGAYHCCGGKIRTYDLWVMSPTSYPCSTPRSCC